ncbi:hypothetical protein [Maricaulis sp.]|uniref:hypothetical protein n=1 Tax=Maricaulis sp. TaxID=1486257 RepID=UPI003A933243
MNRDKLVVGVTEEMSSTMRVIARVTGFSDLDVPHANVSKQFSEFNVDEDRVAEATRILAEKNPLDIRLYDHFRDMLLETGV